MVPDPIHAGLKIAKAPGMNPGPQRKEYVNILTDPDPLVGQEIVKKR